MQQHFNELRTRIVRCLMAFGTLFSVCFFFSNELYRLITAPITRYLPNNTNIIATKVIAPFMIPMQLCFISSLLICAPYLIYNIWMFVRPGLYKHEQKSIAPIIVTSCILFYCGVAFGLFIVSPVALKFFTTSGPNGLLIMLDIGDFVDFFVTIAIACGVAFQIPVVTNLLLRWQIVNKQELIAKRRHIIVLAFILGMILAPPDVMSQIMLALPMWGLFELGLLAAK